MISEKLLKDKLIFNISCLLIILIASFSVITFLTGRTSLSQKEEEKWDGTTVSSSFSAGNGTKENPYLIQNGADFIYFKQLIEGDSSSIYADKYYALNQNINLDHHGISSIGIRDKEERRIFRGHFDGRGYSIKNASLTKAVSMDGFDYYGLFSVIERATIENLNLEGIVIQPVKGDNPYKIGTLVAEVLDIKEKEKQESHSSLSNISIIHSELDLIDIPEHKASMIGAFSGSVGENTQMKNIFIGVQINSNYITSIGKVAHTMKANASNIMISVVTDSLLLENISNYVSQKEDLTISNHYFISNLDGKLSITENEKSISIETLIDLLHKELADPYYWYLETDNLKIGRLSITEIQENETLPVIKNFVFGRSAPIALHDSGINGNTVYVNDLESDYNYYNGLNYTDTSSTGTIPIGNHMNLFTSSNLVKVYIHYKGANSTNSDMTGYVSLEEQQSDFIYYKYYPIVDGYLTMELIDNPYGDRPNDMAFNGWITDYPGAIISIDSDTYVRTVKIPVSNPTETISLSFSASWIDATAYQITSTVNWSTVYNSLNSAGLQAVSMGDPIYEDVDMRNYFIDGGTVPRRSYYPTGAYSDSATYVGGNQCVSYGGCIYYLKSDSATYDPNIIYYEVVSLGGSSYYLMKYEPKLIGYGESKILPIGASTAGFYKQVTIPRYDSYAGYYNQAGVYQTSGTCNTSGGCTYYQYMQYYDDSGNLNVVHEGEQFYYLVTRDTNIVVLRSNNTSSISNTKPMTLTSIYNGNDYRTNATYTISNSYIKANSDLRIEYITLTSNRGVDYDTSPTSSTTSSSYIYGNWYNLKIGRGIRNVGTSRTALAVIAGGNNATGSSNNLTKYRLVIESGLYNTLSGTNGTSSRSMYLDGKIIYGNDYDRITEDNNQLQIYFCASGSWGGDLYSSSTQTGIALSTNVKSGSFGTSKYDYSTGIYVGGRNGGTHYAARDAVIEGGWIYNLIGGPLTASNRRNINDTYINIKGGTIDMVIGGAGASATYGNRIINLTGGTVNYGVFGGSNAYIGSDSGSYSGTLEGSTFLYVGGKSIVGDDQLISNNSTLFGVESGSIFGIGNGNSSSSKVGTADNSNIVIDGNTLIKQNVYGGGNYGTTGISSTSSLTNTKISVLNGVIKGSLYGGGNNNGSGTASVSSFIDIQMNQGTIEGSLYGGSRTKGTVYGETNVQVKNGTIYTDIYGGGEGGYSSSSNPGTFVTRDVHVSIGTSDTTPIVHGSIYGGSAYGSVNGSSNSSTVSSYQTNVLVSQGVIAGSIYGGGKGNSTYKPYVLGNTSTVINGGNIGNVYGGNDQSGSPNGEVKVTLNGGIIGNAYGGGNNTGQSQSNIHLNGANLMNLYGGSNSSGTVRSSKVNVTSGVVTNIYGGNNVGGKTEQADMEINGGTITGDIYGGGSLADTNSSKVILNDLTVHDVYGGGEKASTVTSELEVHGTKIHSLFGGSNLSGDVTNSKVVVHSGTIDNVYGGNNRGGVTTTTNVNILDGTIGNVYGGGDNASSSTSNISIQNGRITNVYGGGNEAGLNTSNLQLTGGMIDHVYGGSNASGNITTSNVEVKEAISSGENPYIDLDVKVTANDAQSWQTSEYKTVAEVAITLSNKTARDIEDWKIQLNMPTDTVIYNNYSGSNVSIVNGISEIDSVGRYFDKNVLFAIDGTYTFLFQVFSNTPKDEFQVSSLILNPVDSYDSSSGKIKIGDLYGGNNQGGLTSKTNVKVSTGVIENVFGGGNAAAVDSTNVSIQNANVNHVYGGGNAAGVNDNTVLDIDNSNIGTNIYGGGNEGTVSGNTDVSLTNTAVLGSAYAGGNGSTAIVSGNTTITVDGDSIVGGPDSKAPVAGCIFGGGNAAATGTVSKNSSIATVNLVGAKVYGNVYGGANTSVVYGKTDTNIGTSAVSKNDLQEDNIMINGTIFGGGEANASGSEIYDYSFISVTGAIDIQVNGKGYLDNLHSFKIAGSIFGSGNASSSSGISDILISYLGTKEAPSQNISIQRADTVTVDHSVLELEGTTDRTNEYSTIKYSFNRINSLTIKNNTTLLLKQNANLLKEVNSAVDINGKLEKATVQIDDETKTVTKNVDNRIYLAPNHNLNITTNEAATAYGKITGMTFFGMYNSYAASGSFSYGVYDSSVSYGDSADAGDVIVGGSYVLGVHSLDHNIKEDGFYSNYLNDDYTEVRTAYIEPTPPDSNYYMWTIGMQAINYSFTLNASKYSSLGTYELSMLDFSKGDTIFNVIGFNSEGLANGVNLVDSALVPKVTNTAAEANKVLGLSMKTETREWTSYGTTKLLGENGGKYTGTTNYKTDSQMVAPSMMFYLYHAKNITLNGDLGTVVVSLQAMTPINEIDYEVHLITITIDITARNYDDGDSYDASITYDKKYEMPSATSVNITNQSQFTAYYSLFAYAEQFEDFYGRGNSNYHVLTTNYALPVGTQITMLDYGISQEKPQYYYYTVTEASYLKALEQLKVDNEVTYSLTDFIKMGSTSSTNTYDDASSNLQYYSEEYGRTIEEFLFIFDFKDTTTTGEHLNNHILFELRNNEDRALVSVLGIRQNLMYYHLYETSNMVLNETVKPSSDYLYYDIPSSIDYTTVVAYNQTESRESIINTNYESSSMGLNVSLLDGSKNQVSSSLLSGTSIKMNGLSYFADSDGIYRIKLAGKVSNLNKTIYLTTDELLPAGKYTLRFVLFASPDGLHNSHALESAEIDIPVTVVGNNNSIIVHSDDKTKVVDGDTGKNSLGVSYNKYLLTYESVLVDPNIRISLYKRDIDSKETTKYQEVPFNQLFGNALLPPSYLSLVGSSLEERMLSVTEGKENQLFFNLNSSLVSGTYRLVFKLYDHNQLIEEENKYIIVKKKIE